MSQLQKYRQRIYDNYISMRTKPGQDAHSERSYQRWAKFAHVRMRGWFPPDTTTPILDLGCGSGHLLYLLDQLGYTNCTGVDISWEQVAVARERCPGATILQGDMLETLAQYHDHFGLIAGLDIIEHFRKEEIFPLLQQIADALRPGGRVILQTPNGESPWFGAVGYADFTHEWFFTPRTLEEVLRMVGLTEFAARSNAPSVQGAKSLARVLIWQVINALLTLWNMAETGGRGSGIYTRVFVATAVKGGKPSGTTS